MYSTKKPSRLFSLIAALATVALLAVVAGQYSAQMQQIDQNKSQKNPESKEPAGPQPSQLQEKRVAHQVPPLSGTGEDAKKAVLAFIDWAGLSTPDEREDVRKMISSASDNKEIAGALCEEAFRAQQVDHSRALLV